MSCPVDLRATALGRYALRALAARVRVIARFERSAYVAGRLGIACIGGAKLDCGPLNVIVPGLVRIPALAAEVRITFDGARIWRPPLPTYVDRLRPGHLPMAGARGMFRSAHPGKATLRAWLETGARGPAPGDLDGLIGLGPGLTPAGDDLVGGALVALHALRRHACAARLGAWATQVARRNTNRISREHLACAAAGEGGAALHALLNAVLRGQPDLAPELAAIDAVGHTSGWDAAAGAALVLELFRRPRKPRARSPARATRPATRSAARPE
jgi:hypothetical protein